MIEKKALRAELKKRRRAFLETVPQGQRALLFRRPPEAIAARIGEGAVVSIFHEMADEVPASNYGRWLFERGHRIVLPWLADRTSPMLFREWENPFDDDLLVADPYGARQPPEHAPALVPDVMFCPLLGFSAQGGRIGYGAGYYDRWLSDHRPELAIGLAWDCQLVDALPLEPHDVPLDLIITPTRIYGPF